ncbi:helix-turn-helix domain-containing protein [Cysteiniphilum litorale]|uniref:helix-turn-helix domain-containing protein n=1 Tax=Cysteiniphilum litorale TaxID=2056700 RepID=UPI003F885CB9
MRHILDESGVTQSKLADKLGIHKQTINRIISQGAHKSKHFSEILKVLEVDKDYVLFGNKKMAYFVDDKSIIRLVNNNFSLETIKDCQVVDFFIKSTNTNNNYLLYESKVGIDHILKKNDLVLFKSYINNDSEIAYKVDEIYLCFSQVSQSVILGKYKSHKNHGVLSNSHGVYIIQKNDIITGQACQIMKYLEQSHD